MVVDPKLVFVATLKSAVSSLILSHSHPSGKLLPSDADKLSTEKINTGCKFLDIQLFDHLIVTVEVLSPLLKKDCYRQPFIILYVYYKRINTP